MGEKFKLAGRLTKKEAGSLRLENNDFAEQLQPKTKSARARILPSFQLLQQDLPCMNSKY